MKTETEMQIEHLLDSVSYDETDRMYYVHDRLAFTNAIDALGKIYEPEATPTTAHEPLTLDQIEAMQEIAIELRQRDHFGG